MKWFCHLNGMPPDRLLVEVFLACPELEEDWSTLKCSHLSNVLVTPHSARGGSRHLPFHVTRGRKQLNARLTLR